MSASVFYRFNNLGRHGEADSAVRAMASSRRQARQGLRRRIGGLEDSRPCLEGEGAHARGLGGGGTGAMRSSVVCWAAPTPVERVMGHARAGVGEGGRRRHRWRWRRTGQLRSGASVCGG